MTAARVGPGPKSVKLISEEIPWVLPTRRSPEEARSAALACAQRVLDGKLPRAELFDILGMLGLL